MSVEQKLEECLRVGQAVLVHAKSVHSPSLRFRSTIRGWHLGTRIILDRPGFGNIDPLHEGCVCIVRFINDGTACAFNTYLTGWQMLNNTRWCHIKWPDTFEVLSFRKHPRVPFVTPCTVQYDGTAAGGTMRDISAGGCGVLTDTTMETGLQVSLDFSLPTGIPIQNMRSIVRNVRLVRAQTVAGCEFMPDQLPAQNEIMLFISQTLSRRETTGGTPSSRFLIIDSDQNVSSQLCRMFSAKGFGSYSASTTIDGFARLRMLGPAAVAVNLRQRDLAADVVVRLIKANAAYISLPVFVFGEAENDVSERAMQSGAAGFIPVKELTTDLFEAMVEAGRESMLRSLAEPQPAGEQGGCD